MTELILNDTLTPIQSDEPIKFQNYLEYLGICWENHYGVIVDPKMFWYMIMSELTVLISKDPDKYSHIFTSSNDKVEIIVPTNNPTILPVDLVIEQLIELIPTDINKLFPEFSTTDTAYQLSISVSLCDTVSPYYNYSMYACGIPKVDIKGTQADWDNLYNSALSLFSLLDDTSNYCTTLLDRLKSLTDINIREHPNTWKNIFKFERCGSGSQVEVEGWIREFYRDIKSPGYISNFPSGISVVKYLNISTNINYELYTGLFNSMMESDYLIPKYGHYIETIE